MTFGDEDLPTISRMRVSLELSSQSSSKDIG